MRRWRAEHADRLLDTALDALVERIDADPELRQYLVRETLRGKIINSFWGWR